MTKHERAVRRYMDGVGGTITVRKGAHPEVCLMAPDGKNWDHDCGLHELVCTGDTIADAWEFAAERLQGADVRACSADTCEHWSDVDDDDAPRGCGWWNGSSPIGLIRDIVGHMVDANN